MAGERGSRKLGLKSIENLCFSKLDAPRSAVCLAINWRSSIGERKPLPECCNMLPKSSLDTACEELVKS
jgi:hypothetical protein